MARILESHEAIPSKTKQIGGLTSRFVTYEHTPILEGGNKSFGQLVDEHIESCSEQFGRKLLSLTIHFPDPESGE